MSKDYSILYLDDEEQNLVSFQALFRRQYNVFTTTSAHEAVDILNNNQIHIIFSDQKMPDVSGVEFFETILPDFPQPVRILLTGYADIEAVIDAINKGQVYRYVAKPWDANELAICIENALDKYRREQELQSKSNDLEQSNAALEQFVFSASQELRNPTDHILQATAVLEKFVSDAEGLQAIQTIVQQTQRLQEFSEQIGRYYSNSRSATENTEVNLEQLIQQAVDAVSSNLTQATWSIQTELKINGAFISDRSRLLIILQNLINNAVRFSDSNKTNNTIEVSVIQNAEKAIFRISDQGIGIDPGKLNQLFTMQVNSEKASAGGINMYLTKSMVDKMQGKISVSSTPSEGTLVTFEIPNFN
jgi:signal transduction histidine kinase